MFTKWLLCRYPGQLVHFTHTRSSGQSTNARSNWRESVVREREGEAEGKEGEGEGGEGEAEGGEGEAEGGERERLKIMARDISKQLTVDLVNTHPIIALVVSFTVSMKSTKVQTHGELRMGGTTN